MFFCPTLESIRTALTSLFERLAGLSMDVCMEVRSAALMTLTTLLTTHKEFFAQTGMAAVTVAEYILPTAQAMWMQAESVQLLTNEDEYMVDRFNVSLLDQKSGNQNKQSLLLQQVNMDLQRKQWEQSFSMITKAAVFLVFQGKMFGTIRPMLTAFLLNMLIHGKLEMAYSAVDSLHQLMSVSYQVMHNCSNTEEIALIGIAQSLWDIAWDVLAGFSQSCTRCIHDESVASASSLAYRGISSAKASLQKTLEKKINVKMATSY
ncbi:MAG: hypothetical protein EZS28_000779 [Streblomastix strix]|uniref:Uncharacterized protein n=1 Tax=Streblomastix strix TaxID=222440 RepID=A0A5J4X9E1_9EUKA|nr:MAG: hypothetical protein EZS28_000779 [Streblomastix strix]